MGVGKLERKLTNEFKCISDEHHSRTEMKRERVRTNPTNSQARSLAALGRGVGRDLQTHQALLKGCFCGAMSNTTAELFSIIKLSV